MQHASHRINAFNVQILLREIEWFQPDVVYPWMLVGLGGLGLMGCLAHLKMPWVWHLMDDVPVLLCTAAGRVLPAFVQGFNRFAQGRFIACSRQLADEIERGGIRLGPDVSVVPNWVEEPLPPPRAAYREGGTLRIVSAAGQVDRRGEKGLDLLVEAAALLRGRGHRNFHIDLYGNVADPSIPDLIHQHELGDFVHLKGSCPQAELMGRLAAYDIFAFPTREREPFGFAPLEAAAVGCVPLVTRTCGFSEWFVHHVHVIKCDRRAPALADALAAAMGGAVDLTAMGRRVASVVRRDFTLERLLPRIEEILERAAAQPRDGAGNPADIHRMALLAERMMQVMVHESIGA